MKPLRALLVGVRGHGGEEVYCARLRDQPPPAVEFSTTFDFHGSCPGARCRVPLEIALNRLVHPWAAPDQGFRVLSLSGGFDILHLHTHPTVLFGRRGLPVVFSTGSSHYHYLRDYEGWNAARIRRRYSWARRAFAALGAIDSLITHERVTLAYTFSEWARRAYLEFGVPAHKIRVLPPGFDTPPAPSNRASGPITFLFLGRSPRRKGGSAVLEAFVELRQTLRDARLLYVTNEAPALTPEGVEVHLTPPEVAPFYARADVFVNPTLAEGWGLTNAEAQGHGLPVISTRVGAIPEVVEDGRTGLLVPPGDGRALLAAMQRLAQEPGLRSELGQRARERFLERYAYAAFQRGLRALYDEAVTLAGRA